MAEKREEKDPQVAQFIAEMRSKFTAADLAKYAESTPTVPFQEAIEELELEYKKRIAQTEKLSQQN